MELFAYIFLFSLIGGVFSLVGGIILLVKENLAKGIFIHLISFAAGTLLGAAFFDLLPESIESGVEAEKVFMWALLGFVIMFLIEGIFLRFHQHDEHHFTTASVGENHKSHPHSAPWMLIAGDSAHNFLDGIAITAAFLVSIPLGIVTAFAVAAHEIPQEIGDFSVMLHSGWKKKKVLYLNISAAFMTTVGAILAFAFRGAIEPVVGYLLALTAGFFIYIAASDLIPDLYRTSQKDKLGHVMGLFLTGIIVAMIIVNVVE
jgi:zinc and cadmium transporter